MKTELVENTDSGTQRDASKRRILILGGGFAGAYTALHLEKRLAGAPDVEIVLAAKENFVLFTPMLHEVAASDVELTGRRSASSEDVAWHPRVDRRS